MKPNDRRREVLDPPRASAIARSARERAPVRPKRRVRSGDAASGESPRLTQRERLIDAMIELCSQAGHQQVSIAQLYSRAGVSPASFYEHFKDKEDCLLAAYRACAERIYGQMAAVVANSEWPEAARLALGVLLEGLQNDPNAGRLLFIEALGGGPAIRDERRRVLEEFERRVDEVLDRTSKGEETLDVPVMAVIGALRHVISRHLRTHAEDQLPSLLGDGLTWFESYARPPRTTRWSTSPHALLDVAPLDELARPAEPARLPPGRHGLPAGVIARSQRTRLINATAELMMSKGYAEATVTDIVAQARVARPVFYEHFTDKQHAFLEAQQHPTEYILDTCAEAYFSADQWPERVWRCFETLIGLIVANPAISHLRLVECYAAGPTAIRRAEEITRSFTIFLKEGYRHRPEARSLPRLCSQAIAGAIFEVIQHHIAQGDPAGLAARLPQLTYIAIAPFTGAEQAIRLVEQIKARQEPTGTS
jgi:AcrR family transcriptional regulator